MICLLLLRELALCSHRGKAEVRLEEAARDN